MDDVFDAAEAPPPLDAEESSGSGVPEAGPSAPPPQDGIGSGSGNVDGATVKHVRIVKCALRRALALPDDQYATVSAAIELYVFYVSRALRRASLALLRHLLHVVDAGEHVPDLYHVPATYWKNWLRLATQGANIAQLPGVTDVNAKLGPPPLPPDVVSLDQVVAYAAITFKTAVCNNAYVPLIPRLQRLVKTKMRAHQGPEDGGVLRPYDVMLHIRRKNPTFDGWPAWLSAFAIDVRQRLGLTDADYLDDEWGKKMDFHRLFTFNVWMQHQFEALDARRIALSPVFNVHRAHVRLDKKVMIGLFSHMYPDHPAIENFRRVQRLHKEERKQKQPGYLHPDRLMDVMYPKKVKKADCTDEEWTAYQKELAEYAKRTGELRRSPEYVTQLRKHRVLVDAVMGVTNTLFAKIPTPKRGGWMFDGSVVTDGVAVSLQYSVARPKPPAVKKRTKRRAVAQAKEYDRGLCTYVPETDSRPATLVIGVDPGRVNIATISYVLNDAATKLIREDGPGKGSWTLTRGEYRTRSGILALDAAKAKRCEPFKARWAALGQDGASLRTSRLEDVDLYLDRLAEFEHDWWEMALQRRESRDAFRRYAGKRAVLDKFFASVKKRLEKMLPEANIQVGYGSAIMSMKPTGRGEVAVPTTGAFRACKRVFTPDAVSVTDESNSTKVEWSTGTAKHVVYAVVERDAAGTLRRKVAHTPARWTPFVPAAQRADVQVEVDRLRNAAKRRRGGMTCAPKAATHEAEFVVPVTLRYPEIRGLRFSPERRMYLDRDREAARTIARLRTQELLGLDRPAPFCRGGAG